MFKITGKKVLNDMTKLMVIDAPRVAKKAKAGQFIILRIDEKGERIPLTIADYNRESGEVTIIFQEVGATTKRLGKLNVGDCIMDFSGPLGCASETQGVKKACVIGGGLGTAIAYPQAKSLNAAGTQVDSVLGFKNKELIILEDEVKNVSLNTYVMTDDGSNGNKGFVTEKLKELLASGQNYDLVIAIGPLPMMKAVCDVTKPYGIKTMISMNSIMIDGTGMCGGCRVIVDGETKFACVDGPDFDGHKVDFDIAMKRNGMYRKLEKESEEHHCKLGLD